MAFKPDPKPPKPPKPKKGYAPLLVLLALLIALTVITSAVSAIYHPPKFDPKKPPRLGKPLTKAEIPVGLESVIAECWFYGVKGRWTALVCYEK